MSGVLSARHVCILSHWATLGGLKGSGATLAVPPTRTGGAFSAHFDKVLGMREVMKQSWYEIKIPCHIRHDVSRSIVDTAALPAFDALENELVEDPGMITKFNANFAECDWAPNYLQHPKVLELGRDKVLPLGIYLDGVKYGYRDGTIGWWLINMATGRRHLLVALAKRDMCRCGCGGNCSVFPVAAFIEWGFAALSEGRYPDRRHDGPWPDPVAARAGESLGLCGVVVVIKGDWSEFASTLGFRSPGFKCDATGGPTGSLRSSEGLSAIQEPGKAKTFEDWDEACRKAEIHVRVANKTELDVLVGQLEFDKRTDGSRGRAMVCDNATHNLKKGDRLDPCLDHPDVANVDACANFPIILIF